MWNCELLVVGECERSLLDPYNWPLPICITIKSNLTYIYNISTTTISVFISILNEKREWQTYSSHVSHHVTSIKNTALMMEQTNCNCDYYRLNRPFQMWVIHILTTPPPSSFALVVVILRALFLFLKRE